MSLSLIHIFYVETDADDRYALHLSAVEQALSPRTRAILLNSPCNPTGEVIPWETLAGIADIARERDPVSYTHLSS